MDERDCLDKVPEFPPYTISNNCFNKPENETLAALVDARVANKSFRDVLAAP